MSEHRCHAKDCTVPVPPKMFMCLQHWRMVPRRLQQEIWKHYRPGQEIDKIPSSPYMVAANNAILSVAEKEGQGKAPPPPRPVPPHTPGWAGSGQP